MISRTFKKEKTPVKPAIFVDGNTILDILRTILSSELVRACDWIPIKPRSTPVSVARTYLSTHHVATALMFNANTLDRNIISEQIEDTRSLMAMAAVGTPFDVIHCVPEIETIFFEDTTTLRRIFPDFGTAFIPQFARGQPKEQLEVLFERGGGPKTMDAFLDELTSDDIEKLRALKLIQQVVTFITNNAAIATSEPR
jgi:hypothetical protein